MFFFLSWLYFILFFVDVWLSVKGSQTKIPIPSFSYSVQVCFSRQPKNELNFLCLCFIIRTKGYKRNIKRVTSSLWQWREESILFVHFFSTIIHCEASVFIFLFILSLGTIFYFSIILIRRSKNSTLQYYPLILVLSAYLQEKGILFV